MLQDNKDRLLIKRIAEGNEEALCNLFNSYSKRMYAYAYRITEDPMAAQDVIQETFIAIWKKAVNFRKEGQVVAWIFSIVRNKSLSARRSFVKHINKEGVDLMAHDSDSVPEIVERIETSVQLKRGLQQLSRDHREVLELVFYQGFSLAETAEICGCPIGTIKSRLSYAKTCLRGELERETLLKRDKR